MSQPNYQYCNIEFLSRHEKSFLGLNDKTYQKLVAKVAGKTIFETEEYDVYKDGGLESLNKHYKELRDKLLDDGWEIVAADNGYVRQMKKLVQAVQTTPSAAQTPSNVELLQQLASLRDAGILTEEEFQTKKAEILKRL
jgi:hypothetical protein